ncbi:hypothetical protein Acsp02_53990 [Actinoplanes sp. NBRC 103695]|nr:hypothetical protein Acsp02_53990 [Actinoplanes sp. NBRC 103695]
MVARGGGSAPDRAWTYPSRPATTASGGSDGEQAPGPHGNPARAPTPPSGGSNREQAPEPPGNPARAPTPTERRQQPRAGTRTAWQPDLSPHPTERRQRRESGQRQRKRSEGYERQPMSMRSPRSSKKCKASMRTEIDSGWPGETAG